jgi:cysteine desulfurase / selenocysteine lyase
MVLKGLIEPGHRVVTGPYEHNSVMRPLYSRAAARAKVAAARGTAALTLDVGHFAELCSAGVDYVVMAHVSTSRAPWRRSRTCRPSRTSAGDA